MSKTYFANLPREKIARDLYDKVTTYYDEVDRTGRLALWRKCHRYYFALDAGGTHEAAEIQRGGDQGELSLLKANHYRNLLQHLLVLVAQQRPAFECRAINTDVKSQIQTILGRNILEYYLRERRLDSHYRQVAEYALVYGEGYLELEWDKNLGDTVAADPEGLVFEAGAKIKSGDIGVRTYDPVNVIRNTRQEADGRPNWYILRRHENRFDLAAEHPKHAQYILDYAEDAPADRLFYYGHTAHEPEDEESIPVYVLYHDRTPACPEGKRVKFLGADLVLEYGDLDYAELPVYPMIANTQHGTSFGYSVAFDLLCVQEAIDLLYSTILSNQAAFGVQNIWMRPGSNLTPSQLGGGLNILESTEKPEPINLTHTPPEIFNFLKGVETLGEVLSGVNSVARGQPEASLKSGSALALVASQAVQFSNGLQAAYVRMEEDSASGIIRMLQTRAKLPRAAVIAGKDNKSYMKDFTGDDLRSIGRVIVDMANPMSQTISGRVEMAKDLLQAGANPEQYYQVVTTGRLEPLIDDKKIEDLLIASENEALRDGKPVISLIVDKHLEHIKSHKQILGGPDERTDPRLVQAVLAHIQEHINHLRTGDQALLNVLGQAPIQVGPDGPTPPQGANAPQPNAQPQPGELPPPGVPVPAPEGMPPEQAAKMPRMPAPATPPPGAPAV